MQIITTKSALKATLQERYQGQSIGFVPTMGALHRGHISLVELALAQNDVAICCIFVNPTQFNNAEDLEKYPRTEEKDEAMLKSAGCHILFRPSVEDIYPNGATAETFDFGTLDQEMEGKHRPGHFAGVATVVRRLFELVEPSKAYFGEKDYQQLAIVRALVSQKNLPVKVVGCPIVREVDGLAMSSRNERLTANQRQSATAIYQALMMVQEMQKAKPIEKTLAKAIESINAHPGLAVEYFQVCDENTMQPIKSWEESKNPRVFVSVFAGSVRLIDNAPV